jgi:hypothetical protein
MKDGNNCAAKESEKGFDWQHWHCLPGNRDE